jgi:hypothetical protein
MSERLVDVFGSNGRILHTYPITLSDTDGSADDAAYKAKALEAAAHGQLVPNGDLSGLTAKMHVSRGGRMEPHNDIVPVNSETKSGLEQAVREQAYLLWEQEGRPEGRADEYWRRASEQILRERTYLLWHQEGMPQGQAADHWRRVQEFEAY